MTFQHHHFLGFQSLRLKPFWNIKEATGPRGKIFTISEANVIWLPSPSSHWKHSTSGHQELAGCQILSRDASCPHPDVFFEGSGLWQFFLFHALSPGSHEQNLVLTFALFFFFFRKLPQSCQLFTCPSPHFLSVRQVKPIRLNRVSVLEWTPDIYVSVIPSISRDCIHSCRECTSPSDHPNSFFLHFQHSQSPVIYLLHHMFWVFSSVLTAASFFRPSSSLPWTLCTGLLPGSLSPATFNTPASAVPRPNASVASHSPKGKSLNFLVFPGIRAEFLILLHHLLVVIFAPLVRKA